MREPRLTRESQPKSPENDLSKYESAIKKFFLEHLSKGVGERLGIPDLDISDPREEDMLAIQSGDFVIRDLQTSPIGDTENVSFHFYVGQTEIHMTGKAAERVAALM